MKKISTVAMFICLGALLYGGWEWVNRPLEPGREIPKEAGQGERTRKVAPPQQHAVRIAVITPPRKAGSGNGPSLATPARFCVDRINARGGVKSLQVELVVLESENSALDSARAAQEAVDAGAVAVIGGYTSSGAMASAEVLQKARIPFIASGATNPDVTRIGDCIFRVNFIDSKQGAVMAEFAHADLRARTAAMLVNVGNRYSPYLAEVFAEQFRQLGGEILWQRDYLYKPGAPDPMVAEFPGDPVDVIFVPGYEEDSAEIIREAHAAGITSTFLGGDGWGPVMFDYVGGAVEGGYYTKAYHPEAGLTVGLQDVLAGWVEKHGSVKRDSTVLALDACHLLLSAMERAESLTPEGIREALARTDGHPGIVGRYSFDAHGDPDKPLTILRLARSSPMLVKTAHPRSVKLGAIFPKTGEAAEPNAMAFEVARYAVDEINQSGGILGHRIELVEYDNESSPVGSRKAAMQAVADGVAAVVGASRSSHSSAMAPVLQSARIPMVTPSATNPGVTRVGDCIFRACFTDDFQGRLLAEFALRELRARTAAILTNVSSEYSLGLGHFIHARFVQEGRVVVETDYLQTLTDFRTILEQVQAAKPDVVFVPGYPRDSVYILRQARQMGIQSTFIGADAWYEGMFDYAGGELEGCYYSDQWHPEVPNEKSRDFVARYSAKHKVHRAGLFALTYDSVHLVADAIRRTGSVKPEDIRKALAQTRDFHGITGRIDFDENGDPRRKPLVILRFGRDATVFHGLVHADANSAAGE